MIRRREKQVMKEQKEEKEEKEDEEANVRRIGIMKRRRNDGSKGHWRSVRRTVSYPTDGLQFLLLILPLLHNRHFILLILPLLFLLDFLVFPPLHLSLSLPLHLFLPFLLPLSLTLSIPPFPLLPICSPSNTAPRFPSLVFFPFHPIPSSSYSLSSLSSSSFSSSA